MNPEHLLRYVIAEALARLARFEPRMDSPAARALMLGTAMVESDLKHLQQIAGPAVGLWQMEPSTHESLWTHYLAFRPSMHSAMRELVLCEPSAGEMRWNLLYACGMSRLRYWRSSDPLPGLDPRHMAAYWKKIYNTRLGAGTVDKAEPRFEQAIRYIQ